MGKKGFRGAPRQILAKKGIMTVGRGTFPSPLSKEKGEVETVFYSGRRVGVGRGKKWKGEWGTESLVVRPRQEGKL